MNFLFKVIYAHRWGLFLVALFTAYFMKDTPFETYMNVYWSNYFISCIIYACFNIIFSGIGSNNDETDEREEFKPDPEDKENK